MREINAVFPNMFLELQSFDLSNTHLETGENSICLCFSLQSYDSRILAISRAW
jgi:hypothetical protein